MWNFESIYKLFEEKNKELLKQGNWGIEKEALRVVENSFLALTKHPDIFDKKTVTRDFSESQLEFITKPYQEIEESFKELVRIHEYADSNIKDEYLWPMSMPCILPDDKEIPIAKFSEKYNDTESELYRKGLALRYGKKMQMISGIHYNYSFTESMLRYLRVKYDAKTEKRDFQDKLYFHLARNILRYRWVLIYLFGASPDADKSYKEDMLKELEMARNCCSICSDIFDYEKYATSLRVSRYGYSADVQKDLKVSYNSLGEHINDLKEAVSKESLEYKKLGLLKKEEKLQLNTNILQKESEYYAPIRFKNTRPKKAQMDLLKDYGVDYLELRILDIDPFEKYGLSMNQLYFIHLFMIYCLFEESPMSSDFEMQEINDNHHITALYGRKEGVKLNLNSEKIELKKYLKKIMDKIGKIAQLMGEEYIEAFKNECEKIENIEKLPSQRIKMDMEKNSESFVEFGIRKAKEYRG